MKTIIKALISLYPQSWRTRYENEFEALLNDVSPTWRTLFDVLGGAIKMQLKIWGPIRTMSLCAAIGVIASMAYSWTIPTKYLSRAILKTDAPDRIPSALVSIEGRAPLARIINEEGLYPDLRAKEPLEDIIESMKRNDIRIHQIAPSAFEVAFAANDPELARRVTNRLSAAFMTSMNAELLDPASPANRNSPRRSRAIWMGLTLGAIVGAWIASLQLLKVWKLAAAMGIAGAVLCAAISYVIPDRYQSTGVLFYETPGLIKPLPDDVLADLIHRFRLYPNDANSLRTLKEHLLLRPVGGANAMSVTFDYSNKYIAQKVVQDVESRLIDQGAKATRSISILDPASLPLQPYSPNHLSITISGLCLGLTCSIVLGIWKRNRRSQTLAAA